MLDHISFGVADLDRSTAFCDAALKPLGLECMFERPRAAAHGAAGKLFPVVGAFVDGPGGHDIEAVTRVPAQERVEETCEAAIKKIVI